MSRHALILLPFRPDHHVRSERSKLASLISRAYGLCFIAVLCALVLAVVTPDLVHAEPKFPALTGRIVDEARLLSPADITELTATLAELEGKSSDQIVVYTTRSLQGYEIEDFGYRLGRFWKIGQAPINNGIVLVVAPNERKVRIEVGRGLEPQMTDFMSKLIVENAILPGFRRGDFAGGIKAGVRDIKDVLLGDAEAVKERARYIKKRATGNDDIVPFLMFLFILFMFIMIVRANARQMQQPGNIQRRRRLGDGNVIIVPGGWGGSGGWSGGGSWGGSGSSDGGGWSGGGGGSFGGGGASGSW